MGIIGTIIIGLIVGLVARFLKPGDDSMGWIMTILLGIGGSLLATYGGQALGLYQAGEGAGFIGAVVGAIILLVIYGMVTSRKHCPAAGPRPAAPFPSHVVTSCVHFSPRCSVVSPSLPPFMPRHRNSTGWN